VSTPARTTTDAAAIARAQEVFARQGAAVAAGAPPLEARLATLRRLKRALRDQRDALAAAVYDDFRKPVIETGLTEIALTIDEITHTIGRLPGWMAPRRVATHPLLGGAAEIRREPKGRVLVLSPWNYPLYLALMPTVAAVAAGNRVIVRPSERAPHAAAALQALVASACPDGEVAVVLGDVPVAEALLDLPFDHVFFTGSVAVGQRVRQAASRHHASVTLELGGKSAAIVTPRADLPRAAARLAWAKWINAGQTCVAPDYVLAHRQVAGALVEAIARVVDHRFGATPEARRVSDAYGRMVDRRAYERAVALLDDAVSRGARVAVGGDLDAAQRYVAPTVLTGVDPGARVLREEIFAPLLPVVVYDDDAEAIAIARAHGAALALYVFSRSAAEAGRFVTAIPSGAAVVNHAAVHLGDPALPFGGRGASGLGRYHGHHGFLELSHERAVLRHGRFAAADLLAPPYHTALSRAIRWFVRRVE
jgi:aldehyde dehydrogenase (NAD+)